MIVHDGCDQGSEAWFRLRMGKPTSSAFNRLLTPKGLKPSSQQTGYRDELLAEWCLGEPLHGESSGFRARGTELEGQARVAFEWEFGKVVRQVGFCTTDDGLVGCSPDGLVDPDGGLEIKCPSAAVHVAYLLDPDKLVAAYAHQVQGALYVTGRSWWDLISYHTGDNPMPMVRVTVEPDERWQAALAKALPAFVALLEEGKARLRELGVNR